MKALFVNTCSVDIGQKRPGEVFKLHVHDDGSPVDLYWRKRLSDGSIQRTLETPAKAVPVDTGAAKATKGK
jgi:hypothetical protein